MQAFAARNCSRVCIKGPQRPIEVNNRKLFVRNSLKLQSRQGFISDKMKTILFLIVGIVIALSSIICAQELVPDKQADPRAEPETEQVSSGEEMPSFPRMILVRTDSLRSFSIFLGYSFSFFVFLLFPVLFSIGVSYGELQKMFGRC